LVIGVVVTTEEAAIDDVLTCTRLREGKGQPGGHHIDLVNRGGRERPQGRKEGREGGKRDRGRKGKWEGEREVNHT